MTEAPTLRPALAASIAEHLDAENLTAPGLELEPLPDGRFLDRELGEDVLGSFDDVADLVRFVEAQQP